MFADTTQSSSFKKSPEFKLGKHDVGTVSLCIFLEDYFVLPLAATYSVYKNSDNSLVKTVVTPYNGVCLSAAPNNTFYDYYNLLKSNKHCIKPDGSIQSTCLDYVDVWSSDTGIS